MTVDTRPQSRQDVLSLATHLYMVSRFAGTPAQNRLLRYTYTTARRYQLDPGFPVEIAQPVLGPIVLEGPSWHADAMHPAIIGPAPRIGEHTRAVCAELLGLDEATIDALFASGVLETTTTQST